MQRVDHTSNISRYIGRYDVSDKSYLSSNLETIFANLIERDEAGFDKTVRAWQRKDDDTWLILQANMGRWLPLKGLWQDQKKFRQVVVEGIYPLHPISTYLLTQMSDYLQNRSSLTLVHRLIDSLADAELEVGKQVPLLYPEQLLLGELFEEILCCSRSPRVALKSSST